MKTSRDSARSLSRALPPLAPVWLGPLAAVLATGVAEWLAYDRGRLPALNAWLSPWLATTYGLTFGLFVWLVGDAIALRRRSRELFAGSDPQSTPDWVERSIDHSLANLLRKYSPEDFARAAEETRKAQLARLQERWLFPIAIAFALPLLGLGVGASRQVDPSDRPPWIEVFRWVPVTVVEMLVILAPALMNRLAAIRLLDDQVVQARKHARSRALEGRRDDPEALDEIDLRAPRTNAAKPKAKVQPQEEDDLSTISSGRSYRSEFEAAFDQSPEPRPDDPPPRASKRDDPPRDRPRSDFLEQDDPSADEPEPPRPETSWL